MLIEIRTVYTDVRLSVSCYPIRLSECPVVKVCDANAVINVLTHTNLPERRVWVYLDLVRAMRTALPITNLCWIQIAQFTVTTRIRANLLLTILGWDYRVPYSGGLQRYYRTQLTENHTVKHQRADIACFHQRALHMPPYGSILLRSSSTRMNLIVEFWYSH